MRATVGFGDRSKDKRMKTLSKHRRISGVISGRFFWLLISLVAFILSAGELPITATGRLGASFLLAAILIAAIYAARGGKKQLIIMVIFSLLAVASLSLSFLFPGATFRCISFGMLLGCLIMAVTFTLGFVLSAGTVNVDHIFGAICAYILIAMIFATVYYLELLFNPGAFKGMDPNGKGPWAELFYFSMTTLSTVGYGDIVPGGRGARSICMLEELTATFYVAVLIARLTGLYAPLPKDASTA
jgi:Ion channel